MWNTLGLLFLATTYFSEFSVCGKIANHVKYSLNLNLSYRLSYPCECYKCVVSCRNFRFSFVKGSTLPQIPAFFQQAIYNSIVNILQPSAYFLELKNWSARIKLKEMPIFHWHGTTELSAILGVNAKSTSLIY